MTDTSYLHDPEYSDYAAAVELAFHLWQGGSPVSEIQVAVAQQSRLRPASVVELIDDWECGRQRALAGPLPDPRPRMSWKERRQARRVFNKEGTTQAEINSWWLNWERGRQNLWAPKPDGRK